MSSTSPGGLGGAGGEGGRGDDSNDEGDGGGGGAAGAAVSGEITRCVPTDDAPDDDFEDTNCDGIDGDAERAVFVSTDGSDEGMGTIDDPVQTLQQAVDLAVERGHDVYVCNGTYFESLLIESAVDLYGGYDCKHGWQRILDRAVIESPTSLPLSVVGVSEPMVVERFVLRGPPPAGARKTAQAARVLDTPAIRFSRVEFYAPDGADGKAGPDGHTHVAQEAPAGGDAADAPLDACKMRNTLSADCRKQAQGGDRGFVSQCTDPYGAYEHRGGRGGDGANAYLSSADCGDTVNGAPGDEGMPSSSTKDGTDGAPARDGATASVGFGRISNGFYQSSNAGTDGEAGNRGTPGRGGNGGESVVSYTNQGFCEGDYSRGGGGGQGGYAGCAGFPGDGGSAGGGSIGLVIVNSGVALHLCNVITGSGGKGGAGGVGSEGQKGGEPGKRGNGSTFTGASSTSNAGEDGGRGGNGSRGGHGGAGGGGPSIGIVVVGAEPELSECTFVLGEPGFGGAAVIGPDATDGVGAEVYTLAP